MGNASKWLNKLLRRKKRPNNNNSQVAITGNCVQHHHQYSSPGNRCSSLCHGHDSGINDVDPSKHAAAIAAATAAVAEAALAAAQAAAEVVRLTSSGRCGGVAVHVNGVSGREWSLEDLAAIKIQSAFRGYLARRALRALKGLVKLQALVRGYFVRKQSADMLRRMQAMVRLQAQACASRIQNGLKSREKYKHQVRANYVKVDDSSILKRCCSVSAMREARTPVVAQSCTKWLESWMECPSQGSMKVQQMDDGKSNKILGIDSWRPHLNPKSRNRIHISSLDYYDHSFAASDSLANYRRDLQKPNASPFSDQEVSSLRSLDFPLETCTAESSPMLYSVPSRPGSSSRSSRRTECLKSPLSSYVAGHPNYMANTESSRAKLRCQSAPRLRPESEKHQSTKRSIPEFQDLANYSRRSFAPVTSSPRKLDSGSGYLDRLVLHARGNSLHYSYSFQGH
ncbi:Protein of unknown function (DUF4005) [Ancistrocladus abbreviatus]